MRVAFLTLGCKVNYYETEKMIGAFREKGFSVVDFEEEADVYVINTCTVTNIADRKSRQMLHRARKKAPHALIVAVGCYVDSAGDRTNRDEAVDVAYGNADKPRLAELVSAELGNRLRSRQEIVGNDTHPRRTRAFLKVQDGCNQFCSYCLIPFVRGRGELTSSSPEEVCREVRDYVDQGIREVVLTGIHLSSYGVEVRSADGFVKEKGKKLLDLICRVNEVSGLERIRLGSLEPRIITEEWLEGLASCEKLCPHFHLSLQSGCDATLQRMNRHYTTAEYRERVELLRRYYEAPAVTTDVIVGFPGETEEEFAETEAFLRETGFADLHIFQYSRRDGTRAAEMKDQIPSQVKKQRSERLLARVPGWQERYRQSQEREVQRILFEEYTEKNGELYLTGYNERYVRYGIPGETAEKAGYEPGRCYSVPEGARVFLSGE